MTITVHIDNQSAGQDKKPTAEHIFREKKKGLSNE